MRTGSKKCVAIFATHNFPCSGNGRVVFITRYRDKTVRVKRNIRLQLEENYSFRWGRTAANGGILGQVGVCLEIGLEFEPPDLIP